MNTTQIETIPQDWNEERDLPFFRVSAGLFSPAFCFGASVLLASYDDHPETSPIATEPRAADAPPATVDSMLGVHSQPKLPAERSNDATVTRQPGQVSAERRTKS